MHRGRGVGWGEAVSFKRIVYATCLFGQFYNVALILCSGGVFW